MNADIKDRWVRALRSGEYTQTTGALYRPEPVADHPAGFCCLGVLCDLAVKDGAIRTRALTSGSVGYVNGEGTEREYVETAVLPREVIEWAGLASEYGLEWGDETLATVNDAGETFTQIADRIEAGL